MTKKELKIIEELLFGVYDKGLQQEDCNLTEFANKIEEAINYTRCSTQLKDKKTITFDEFTKENNYKQNFLYFYRDGKTFKPSEIMRRYRTYLQSL